MPERSFGDHIGFVGLGDRGQPMARRLVDAGYPVRVHARRPEQASALLSAGATWAASIGELAAASDVFAVCVGNDVDVEEVFASALTELRVGAIAIIHSTVHPQTCRRIGEQAGSRGMAVVDAPVSGGRQRAFDGQLTVMVGGPADAVAVVRPMLDAFASLVLHVGPLGSGELLKLVNNYVFTAHLDVAAQAVELVRSLGLDVGPAMEAIAASTGSSRCIEWFVASGCVNVFPRHVKGRTHGAALLGKDVDHLRRLIDDAGLERPRLDATVAAGLAMAVGAGAADRAQSR
jgi:3-hydroxyisobutyrate dehydrogenase-like beta-hydroxyacid dehydrogenase